ncbi:multiubiquitin domain-containing protein [Herbaspirillum sp. ST 5-3]|uniref:multiubiquitin domain-containing protein n=1 Tax=Oxalobacteraceae TaxID=75682 RepID=UPI001455FB29|nr:multiubiquitin domain-containing protein [Herbaspirillum sp. ST 5-3]
MKKYHFKIENDTYDWPNQIITGAEVRGVGPGIPESMDLFIKRKGKAGVLVANTDKFDLDEPGIEKFYAQDASSEAGEA